MSEKPKSKGGRPSTYKTEYCEMVIDYMAKGNSLTSFAASIHHHTDSLYEWAKKHPEFSVALKKGRQMLHKWWEDLGKAIVTGQKTDKFDAKRTNPTVFIWMTKNLLGWRDQIDHYVENEPIILKIRGQKEKYELGTGIASEARSSVVKRPKGDA